MSAPRFHHGFTNDVFISYANVDDSREPGASIGWVQRFAEELRARLAMVSGQTIQVWLNQHLSLGQDFASETQKQLLSSAVLVPILTPSYLTSRWCRAELSKFVASHPSSSSLPSRVLPVEKTPVDRAGYPDELSDLLAVRFYVQEPDGGFQEFLLSPDAETQVRFHAAVDAVAQAIVKILRSLEPGAGGTKADRTAAGTPAAESAPRKQQQRRAGAPPPAKRRFFLCYRRDDSAAIVGRMYDKLALQFGAENVFKDVDNIPFGIDFVEHLDREVQKCDALFVVIGARWLEASPEGGSRLDEPNDFVRIEIAAALHRAIPVVPLLVDGAQMPRAEQLPEEIRPLSRRNGMPVRHDPDFHNDMARLLSRLG